MYFIIDRKILSSPTIELAINPILGMNIALEYSKSGGEYDICVVHEAVNKLVVSRLCLHFDLWCEIRYNIFK